MRILVFTILAIGLGDYAHAVSAQSDSKKCKKCAPQTEPDPRFARYVRPRLQRSFDLEKTLKPFSQKDCKNFKVKEGSWAQQVEQYPNLSWLKVYLDKPDNMNKAAGDSLLQSIYFKDAHGKYTYFEFDPRDPKLDHFDLPLARLVQSIDCKKQELTIITSSMGGGSTDIIHLDTGKVDEEFVSEEE